MYSQSLHNLPKQPNVMLGRDQELKAARENLLSNDVRLLTLTGPPGVGKTRLGIAVAESILEAFPQGVRFIDLSPFQDPLLVGSTIASVFGITENRANTALDSLAAYLNGRQILLFLDNFEGVLPASSWIGKLLERTSGLKILTTSRERLRLRWERVVLVPPLPLPDIELPSDWSALTGNPSITLFVQRAAAVNANFSLSAENAADIAALCNRLDGLPLAIELVAAYANVLSPAEILANMDDRFRLLNMGAVDLPARHQTLKAAIDCSYESLSPAERQFLCRLSVFVGGFSLKAAEVVAECEDLGLDGLSSLIHLVEKSLVTRTQGLAGETRFAFLESIRAYLLDRLRSSGELNGVRRRHAKYYLEQAEWNYSELKKSNQKIRFDLLEADHDNLRAALQWSLDTGEHSLGKRIAAALWNFWWLHGHVREGIHWLEMFLETGGESQDDAHLRVLEGAGALLGWQGDFESGRDFLADALRIAQEREDQAAIARILFRFGLILWVNGKTEETDWLAEKIESSAANADPWELAHAYLSLGNLLYEAGQDEAAEKAFRRSRECFQFAEEKHVAIIAGSKLALLDEKKGDYQEAQKGMLEAVETIRQSIDLYVIAYCVDDAVQLVMQRMVEQNIARERDIEKVAPVLGAVDHWRENLSLMRTPREKLAYLQITKNLKRRMGQASYLGAWQKGQSLPAERVIDEVSRLLETINRPPAKGSQLAETGEQGITAALSERERQVIGFVAEGLSNREIGERLFITERTVRFHITSILNKLGADNRAQAVAIANRLGIL